MPTNMDSYFETEEKFYLCNYYGIHKTTDDAVTWETLLYNHKIYKIDLRDTNNFYAATYDGFFYSSDAGVSWEDRSEGLDFKLLSNMALDSRGHIYLGSWSGLSKSTDKGKAWKKINKGFVSFESGAICIDQTGDIFLGGSVFISRPITEKHFHFWVTAIYHLIC
jgi:ligand-binding sensor domain-containing protein